MLMLVWSVQSSYVIVHCPLTRHGRHVLCTERNSQLLRCCVAAGHQSRRQQLRTKLWGLIHRCTQLVFIFQSVANRNGYEIVCNPCTPAIHHPLVLHSRLALAGSKPICNTNIFLHSLLTLPGLSLTELDSDRNHCSSAFCFRFFLIFYFRSRVVD